MPTNSLQNIIKAAKPFSYVKSHVSTHPPSINTVSVQSIIMNYFTNKTISDHLSNIGLTKFDKYAKDKLTINTAIVSIGAGKHLFTKHRYGFIHIPDIHQYAIEVEGYKYINCVKICNPITYNGYLTIHMHRNEIWTPQKTKLFIKKESGYYLILEKSIGGCIEYTYDWKLA